MSCFSCGRRTVVECDNLAYQMNVIPQFLMVLASQSAHPLGGGSVVVNSLLAHMSYFLNIINSEYDQEIPQSQTADIPVARRGRAAQPSQDTRKTN